MKTTRRSLFGWAAGLLVAGPLAKLSKPLWGEGCLFRYRLRRAHYTSVIWDEASEDWPSFNGISMEELMQAGGKAYKKMKDHNAARLFDGW